MLWKIILLQINNLSFTRFSTLCFNFCSIFSFELRLYYHKQIFIHSHLTHSFTSLSEEVFFLESDIPRAVFITFTFSINFFCLSFICNDLSHDEQIWTSFFFFLNWNSEMQWKKLNIVYWQLYLCKITSVEIYIPFYHDMREEKNAFVKMCFLFNVSKCCTVCECKTIFRILYSIYNCNVGNERIIRILKIDKPVRSTNIFIWP